MSGAVSVSRASAAVLALLGPAAVASAPGCASERGPRPADEVITWSGYVLGGPASTEEDVLADGAVQFLTGEGEGVAAEAPYTDYPGYWTVDLPPGVDPHGPEAYRMARRNLDGFVERGWLQREERPAFYLYSQTWRGRTQTGLMGAFSLEEYDDGRIKPGHVVMIEAVGGGFTWGAAIIRW